MSKQVFFEGRINFILEVGEMKHPVFSEDMTLGRIKDILPKITKAVGQFKQANLHVQLYVADYNSGAYMGGPLVNFTNPSQEEIENFIDSYPDEYVHREDTWVDIEDTTMTEEILEVVEHFKTL